MVPTLRCVPPNARVGRMPGSQSTDHHRRNRTVHKKLKKICRRLNLQSYSAGWAKFYTPTDLIATREWVRTTLAAHSQPHTHTHTHTTADNRSH
jgi:hypothetical protein